MVKTVRYMLLSDVYNMFRILSEDKIANRTTFSEAFFFAEAPEALASFFSFFVLVSSSLFSSCGRRKSS